MKDNFDKQLDQTQKPDSGQGAGQSSQFDLGRQLIGADGRRNTCIPQSRLFKNYISYTYEGPDVPPQHSDETLSTSFRHDVAPSQESPMSAFKTLETMMMIRDDDVLLHQAAKHYEQSQFKEAELALRCALDNCANEPEPNSCKIELIAYGLAEVYKRQERHGDAIEIYKSILKTRTKAYEGRYKDIGQVYDFILEPPQPNDLMLGLAMKGLGDVFEERQMHKEAKALLKSTLDIFKKEFGDTYPTAEVMKSLAKVYEMQQKPAKANALLHEYVLPIFKKEFGENDPRTEEVSATSDI